MENNTPAPHGALFPFVFDNIPVRGLLMRINDASEYLPQTHPGQSELTQILGDMLAASAILNYDVNGNNKGAQANINLQIESNGAVPLLVSQCSHKGNIRAYAQMPTHNTPITYADIATNGGIFAATIEHTKNAQAFQSLVALNSTSVASSIEDYFNHSVQLPSYLKVKTHAAEDKTSIAALFLQALPHEEDASDGDDWRRMGMLMDTLQAEELLPGALSEHELLFRLFHEDQVRTFEPQPLYFAVSDTREKMERALKSIGIESCRELLQEGPIVMTCEFTGKEETFHEEDVRNIFGTQWNEKTDF